MLRTLQRPGEALDHHQKALAINREINAFLGEGHTLHYLGLTYQQLHRYEDAVDCLQQAATLFRRTNSQRFGVRRSEAEALCVLGDLLHDNGQTSAAAKHWQRALTIFDELDIPQAADVAARLNHKAGKH